MVRPAFVLAGAWLVVLALSAPAALRAQDAAAQAPAVIRRVEITGAKEIAEPAIRATIGLDAAGSVTADPTRLAENIAQRYRDEGYTFARVTTQFDAATATLDVKIDEGIIDGIEFHGVDDALVRRF